jgi:hypothetical protein
MPLSKFDRHSFVIRIWLEESAEETGRTNWRGHITHVQSGQRKYFNELADVQSFIITYLRLLGAEDQSHRPLASWLRRIQRCIQRFS